MINFKELEKEYNSLLNRIEELERENDEYKITENENGFGRCRDCEYWNMPEIVEEYGEDVCSQFYRVVIKKNNKVFLKVETPEHFGCTCFQKRTKDTK